MATSDPLIKHYDKVTRVDIETGEEVEEMVPVRYMDANEIKEREELNRKNTSEAQRRRVIEELGRRNGH